MKNSIWLISILLFAQEPPPVPGLTPEIPYPIEPGTSTFGLIIGAVVIVLIVLGGVIFATLTRYRGN